MYYIHNVWKINMVPDFSMYLWLFSAIILATTKPTQQMIAKVKNYHSSLAKVPVSYFKSVKTTIFWTNLLRDWFWPSFWSNFLKLLVPVDLLGPVLWNYEEGKNRKLFGTILDDLLYPHVPKSKVLNAMNLRYEIHSPEVEL